MAGSTLKTLAVANMVEGCVIVLFQLAMLITLHDWVDWICIGFWGGGLMIATGLWALQKNPKRMIPAAGMAIFSGLCLIGFFSWHVSTVNCEDYQREITRSGNNSWQNNSELCDWRLAADIVFIIFGLMTIGINIFLAAAISSAIGNQRRRRSTSPPSSHNPPPPPQVVYVTTTPGYPPHAQPGYNPYPSAPINHPAYSNPPPYNPTSSPYEDHEKH